MKPLSKLHQEAIIKAQSATDQNKAAALAMIETPMELIKAIMLKHELAVIEVMRELHESKEAAVRAEREACAKVCDGQGSGRKALEHYAALTYVGATHDCAAAIRARGET